MEKEKYKKLQEIANKEIKYSRFNNNDFDDLINTIKKYKEEGEILKVNHDDLKNKMNKMVDKSWKIIRNKISENVSNDDEVTKEYEYISYEVSLVYITNINSVLKKISNKKNVDQDNINIIYAKEVLEELKEFSEELASMKNLIVKKKKEKVKEEEEKKQNELILLSHKDVKKVKSKLEEYMSDIRSEILLSREYFYDKKVEKIKEEAAKNLNGYELYKKMSGDYLTRKVFNIVNKSNRMHSFELNDEENIKIKTKELAKQDSDDIVDFFINKMTSKLAPVIFKKDNLKEILRSDYNVNNGLIEMSLGLRFEDKSSFNINSSVEYSYSKLDNIFLRFPSRFSDITLPDGSKLKNPSENVINNEFINFDSNNKRKSKLKP